MVALLFCNDKILLKKAFQEEHFTHLVEDIEIQKYVKLKVDKITFAKTMNVKDNLFAI